MEGSLIQISMSTAQDYIRFTREVFQEGFEISSNMGYIYKKGKAITDSAPLPALIRIHEAKMFTHSRENP